MKVLKIKKILATNRIKKHSAINGSINAIACTPFYYNNMHISWMLVSFLTVHIILLFALIFFALANPDFKLDS